MIDRWIKRIENERTILKQTYKDQAIMRLTDRELIELLVMFRSMKEIEDERTDKKAE